MQYLFCLFKNQGQIKIGKSNIHFKLQTDAKNYKILFHHHLYHCLTNAMLHFEKILKNYKNLTHETEKYYLFLNSLV